MIWNMRWNHIILLSWLFNTNRDIHNNTIISTHDDQNGGYVEMYGLFKVASDTTEIQGE